MTWKVLVGCEESATIREAFKKVGWFAVSCDLLPSRIPGLHYQGDILDLINEEFHLAIFNPPCTDTDVSGARHFYYKKEKQEQSLCFIRKLLESNFKHIGLEQPVSIVSTRIRKPDQIIQPYMFGHPEQKKTCLWLKNLPPLTETNNVKEEMMFLPYKDRARVHMMPPGKDRAKQRSKTYPGIAQAMAEQWSKHIITNARPIGLS